MGDRSREKLREVEKRLLSGNAEERRRAICDLPGGWVPGALDVLITALSDEDWRVRKEAVGRVSAWPDVDGAVVALLGVLRVEDDVGWRNAVVEALSRIGQPAVGALLTELDAEGAQRKFLVDILGAIGDSNAVGKLVEVLSDDDGNLRMAAAEALRDIGDEASLGALRSCLDAEDVQLRLAALDGLAVLRASVPVDEILPSAEQVILRQAAFRLLGWTGDARALEPLLAALTDERRPMRVAALMAAANLLEHLKASEAGLAEPACALAAPALVNVRAELSSPGVESRRAAAILLGCAQDQQAVPLLAEALDDPDVGRVCAEAIASFGQKAVNELVSVARGAEGELRVAVFDLMASAELEGAAVESLLLEALADDDEEVAATAARTLGDVAGAGDSKSVLVALEQALAADDVPEVASAAATAIGELAARGLAPEARSCLEHSIDSEEPEVRAASALALAATGDGAVVEIIAAHLTDDDAYARLAAIRALASTGKEGQEILRQRLTQENDAEMVDAIRTALDENGGGRIA